MAPLPWRLICWEFGCKTSSLVNWVWNYNAETFNTRAGPGKVLSLSLYLAWTFNQDVFQSEPLTVQTHVGMYFSMLDESFPRRTAIQKGMDQIIRTRTETLIEPNCCQIVLIKKTKPEGPVWGIESQCCGENFTFSSCKTFNKLPNYVNLI